MPGFLQTLPRVPFRVADSAVYPFTLIHLSCERDDVLSAVSPRSESPNLGVGLGTPSTRSSMAGPKGSCSQNPPQPRVVGGRQPGFPTPWIGSAASRGGRASGLEEGWCINPRARGHNGTTGTSNRGQMETVPSANWALPHHGGRCKEKGRHPTRCLSPRPSHGGHWELGSPLGKRRKGRGNLQLTVFIS